MLELGDEFLKFLDFPGAQVRPRAGYHPLQLLTESSRPLRLGFQLPYRRRLRACFTAANEGAFGKNLVLVAHIHDSDTCLLPSSNRCPGYVQSLT